MTTSVGRSDRRSVNPTLISSRGAIGSARENTWRERVGRIKEGIVRMHPRISIVIVTYNNLEYNRLCLESVFRNTLWPNFEVIVVDNASADGTPEYLLELQRAHDNVKVILNEQIEGLPGRTIRGWPPPTGTYLVLLNNDTVVPNGWLIRTREAVAELGDRSGQQRHEFLRQRIEGRRDLQRPLHDGGFR